MSEVEDVLEISKLKHRYCQYIDNKEYEKWRNLFTETGSFGRKGANPFVGEEELKEFNREVFEETYRYSAHFLANPVITVEGDRAEGQWYLLLLYEMTDGSSGWKHATYDDEYERVDGEWLIDSTTVAFQSAREFGSFELTD